MADYNLDELRIASPCSASWSAMNGDDLVRHCGDCNKNVYNLSLLTRAEANDLIREKEGKLCVSLYRRFDGTILTADCPVGLRAIRRQYLKTRARIMAFTVTLWAAIIGSISSCNRTSQKSSVSAAESSGNKPLYQLGQVAMSGEPTFDTTVSNDTTYHFR